MAVGSRDEGREYGERFGRVQRVGGKQEDDGATSGNEAIYP